MKNNRFPARTKTEATKPVVTAFDKLTVQQINRKLRTAEKKLANLRAQSAQLATQIALLDTKISENKVHQVNGRTISREATQDLLDTARREQAALTPFIAEAQSGLEKLKAHPNRQKVKPTTDAPKGAALRTAAREQTRRTSDAGKRKRQAKVHAKIAAKDALLSAPMEAGNNILLPASECAALLAHQAAVITTAHAAKVQQHAAALDRDFHQARAIKDQDAAHESRLDDIDAQVAKLGGRKAFLRGSRRRTPDAKHDHIRG